MIRSTHRRGRHKVFIGMAPGVGKTYRMLQEGKAMLREGTDVVVGLLETHGRAETAQQAEGVEQIPRKRMRYQDVDLEEMDVAAVLARHPQLVLVDELAHTNVPGSEREKRWQDAAAFRPGRVFHVEHSAPGKSERSGGGTHRCGRPRAHPQPCPGAGR
jgi:two-component system sensor histidine kinase KdpD